jgi:hypothetical protein
MWVLLVLLMTILTATAPQSPAKGQGVFLANSDPVVTIHSTFTGQSITLFGNIEPGTGSVPQTGPMTSSSWFAARPPTASCGKWSASSASCSTPSRRNIAICRAITR